MRREHGDTDLLTLRQWLVLTAAAGATLSGATYAALLLGSQFFTDDFLYLYVGQHGDISWSWLSEPSYGHFAPIFRLIYAFVARVGGVSWPLAAGVLTLLVALLYVSLAWFTRLTIGRRPAAIVVAVAGAATIPGLRTVLWMASGVQVLGGAFCMTLCMAAFIAYLRTGRRALLAMSVAALALGLVWQERPILTIGYLVLIRYLFFPPDRGTSLARLALRELAVWVCYFAVIVPYLGYRLFVFDSSPSPGDAGEATTLFASGFFRSYLPSLVGVRLPQDSGWVEPATVLGALVLVGAFVLLALVRRGVWRSVVFLVATYGANVVVQAAGRLGADGVDAVALSRDLQYFLDPYLATLMALCLGFTLPRRERATADASSATGSRGPARWVLPVSVTAAVAIAASTLWSWSVVTRDNAQTYTHGYLNRALDDITGQAQPFGLVSLQVPYQVSPPFVAPYTDHASFFSIDSDLARKFQPISPRRMVIRNDGSLVPVHPLTVGEKSGVNGCLDASTPTLSVSLPFTAPGDDLLAVQVTYSADEPTRVKLGTQGATSTWNQWPSRMPPGQDVSVVRRLDDAATGDRVVISLPKSASGLCVSDVWVGMLAIDTPDGCRVINQRGEALGIPADCSVPWPAGTAKEKQ